MIRVGKIFYFSAAHYLPGNKGPCANIHGHNYKLEVEVTGDIYQGMIIDFHLLKGVIERTIIDVYDHKSLNEFFDNPTAENMVLKFATDIKKCLSTTINLTKLKLWETETCYAIWESKD